MSILKQGCLYEPALLKRKREITLVITVCAAIKVLFFLGVFCFFLYREVIELIVRTELRHVANITEALLDTDFRRVGDTAQALYRGGTFWRILNIAHTAGLVGFGLLTALRLRFRVLIPRVLTVGAGLYALVAPVFIETDLRYLWTGIFFIWLVFWIVRYILRTLLVTPWRLTTHS